MKYINFIFLCFILFGFGVNPAQSKMLTNDNLWGLTIEMKDGSISSFALQEHPKVSFTDGKMTVSLRDFSMDLANIKRWYFEAVPAGINNINYTNLKMAYNNSVMVFEGDNLTNSQVSVYDVQGRAITPHVDASVNRVSVSLEAMPTGNYIIVFNNISYKVFKK